jgi:hypothetical protein
MKGGFLIFRYGKIPSFFHHYFLKQRGREFRGEMFIRRDLRREWAITTRRPVEMFKGHFLADTQALDRFFKYIPRGENYGRTRGGSPADQT